MAVIILNTEFCSEYSVNALTSIQADIRPDEQHLRLYFTQLDTAIRNATVSDRAEASWFMS